MLKKLIVLSGILSLSGCVGMSESGNCDPNLNYLKSNIPAMQEYSKLKKERKIKSIYTEYKGPAICSENDCLDYNQQEYDFSEVYFNDSKRKGIYTVDIDKSKKYDDDDCFKSIRYHNCLKISKNDNNEIKSKYKYSFDASRKENIIISFVKISGEDILYQTSYQIYETGGIGAPSGTYCKRENKNINDMGYSFDVLSFPSDGILTKTK